MTERIFSCIEKNYPKYTEFLKDICCFETNSKDKESIDKMVNFIYDFASNEGLSIKRTKFDKCGDFLTVEINEGKEKGNVFLAHMDTVHSKGIFGYPPAKFDGERLKGPGTIDCKGGIAIALLTLKALLDCGYDKHTRLILTSDEEVSNILGGEKEQEFIKNSICGFRCALNCETARGNQVVVSRKGIIRLEINIKGKGGHSGIDYFTSASAVREAAYKIIELEKSSREGATTYNCSIIEGGSAGNAIPETCRFITDIRVCSREAFDEALEYVKSIVEKSFVEGTASSMNIISKRIPMVKNDDTIRLFDMMQNISTKYNLGELVPVESGGGSDSAYTQSYGVPSLCGLGGSGDGAHTEREYINTASVPQRAKMLSAFCVEVQYK